MVSVERGARVGFSSPSGPCVGRPGPRTERGPKKKRVKRNVISVTDRVGSALRGGSYEQSYNVPEMVLCALHHAEFRSQRKEPTMRSCMYALCRKYSILLALSNNIFLSYQISTSNQSIYGIFFLTANQHQSLATAGRTECQITAYLCR